MSLFHYSASDLLQEVVATKFILQTQVHGLCSSKQKEHSEMSYSKFITMQTKNNQQASKVTF